MTCSLSGYVLRCNLILILNAFIWCISYYHSSHSCTGIVASHLGALDAQRVDVKHVIMESNQKTVLVDLSWRWKDFESICLNRRCLPSECHITNTYLVLDPRQAPEHSRPTMFSKYQLEYFYVDALSTRGWLEPLAAYTFLVQTNISWILCRSRIKYMLSYA